MLNYNPVPAPSPQPSLHGAILGGNFKPGSFLDNHKLTIIQLLFSRDSIWHFTFFLPLSSTLCFNINYSICVLQQPMLINPVSWSSHIGSQTNILVHVTLGKFCASWNYKVYIPEKSIIDGMPRIKLINNQKDNISYCMGDYFD